MAGILMDMDTGDPVIDPETGSTIPVDDNHAFKQVIYGLLNCRPGSELLNIYYGFDIVMAIRSSHLQDAELYIQSLLAEALDSKKEKLISNVNFIEVIRDGLVPGKMNVTIDLNSILGNHITLSQIIGD